VDLKQHKATIGEAVRNIVDYFTRVPSEGGPDYKSIESRLLAINQLVFMTSTSLELLVLAKECSVVVVWIRAYSVMNRGR
jgi:hypothetical protein